MAARQVTLVVDGVEVSAQDGTMLVDAAKHGDVEIPVFCYEPKLGAPVGACRMCLVEIEGIPKLQTACSTPVRDGMVVYTQTDRVNEAQSAVVEFLLVNHPLDCPVCDKGGECPLQDIAMGWGPGKSRMTDPKRHFQKPLPLSPLVKIDRERCILCYRCVRFSQEVAEDEQLQLLERGDRTYVGTFDDRPYIAPFHGNIIELCPVGALTSETYRFRARPWDIEAAGSVCTLCPSQCNVAFTVRDEQVKRVLGRDNHAVDDGWLCDKGRFGYGMIGSPERITRPMINMGGTLEPVSWAEAIEAAAKGLKAAGANTGAILGGGTSNEEGYLIQRIVRQALGGADIDSNPRAKLSRETLSALADPALSAATTDIDSADIVLVIGTDPLHSSPIIDLRIRKVVRRNNTRLLVASDRPTALDGGADEAIRYVPGSSAEFLTALAGEATGAAGDHDAGRIAAELKRHKQTVIVWGSRLLDGEDAESAARSLIALAKATDAGLMEIPEDPNARGLRESGCIPTAGPGFTETTPGRGASEIRDALESGDLSGLILANANPVRDYPDGACWSKALQAADFTVAFSMFANESTKQANVVFPAESHAEKDGTVTHPDGRLQRVRANIPHRDDLKPGWLVLVELAAALDHETGLDSQPEVLEALAAESPIYAGISNEEIGGRGVRWQDREAAASLAGGATGVAPAETSRPRPPGQEASEINETTGRGVVSDGAMPVDPPNGHGLRIGTYRDLWASEATERNEALGFLLPKQTFELSPHDAERLGVANGDEVNVRSNGTSITARAAIRARVRPGSAFLIDGIAQGNASALVAGTEVEVEVKTPEVTE